MAHYIAEFLIHFVLFAGFYAWGYRNGAKLEAMQFLEKHEVLYRKSQAFDKIQAVPRNEWQEYYMDDVTAILEEFEKEGD